MFSYFFIASRPPKQSEYQYQEKAKKLENQYAYQPTLERENNGDLINDIFWLCMKFKTTISI